MSEDFFENGNFGFEVVPIENRKNANAVERELSELDLRIGDVIYFNQNPDQKYTIVGAKDTGKKGGMVQINFQNSANPKDVFVDTAGNLFLQKKLWTKVI